MVACHIFAGKGIPDLSLGKFRLCHYGGRLECGEARAQEKPLARERAQGVAAPEAKSGWREGTELLLRPPGDPSSSPFPPGVERSVETRWEKGQFREPLPGLLSFLSCPPSFSPLFLLLSLQGALTPPPIPVWLPRPLPSNNGMHEDCNSHSAPLSWGSGHQETPRCFLLFLLFANL